MNNYRMSLWCTVILFSWTNIIYAEDYNLDIIVFKQSLSPTNEEFNHPYQVLPNIKNITSVFLHKEPRELSKTNLSAKIDNLVNHGYEIIFSTFVNLSLDNKHKESFIITNQEELAQDIQDKSVNLLDYYGRSYTINSHDKNILIGTLAVEALNSNSVETNIHIVNSSMTENKIFETALVEKRKIHLQEVNYFDNSKIGLLLLLSKTTPG